MSRPVAAQSSIPTKVANGRLIKQMELWGWVKSKNRGDRWVMADSTRPNVPSVSVMAPQVHKGNSTATIRMVYDLVCGGDAEAFWARKAPYNVPTTDAIVDTVVTQGTYHFDTNTPDQIINTGDAVMVLHVSKGEPPAEEPQPAEQEDTVAEEALSEEHKRQRGIAAQVLGYMEAHPHETATGPTIAARTPGLDASNATNALAYLCKLGHVERVMRGTYRLSPNLAAEKVYRHEHTGGLEVPKVPKGGMPTSLPVGPGVVPIRPEASNPPVVETDSGDDLDALLELILPEDYRFHPSHIRAMRKWQEATAELLHILRNTP